MPFPTDQPARLSSSDARKIVREIAADSRNIVFPLHARERMKQRKISALQVQQCLMKGIVSEPPYVNAHGLWEVTMSRPNGAEPITVPVAIDWKTRVIVVTVKRG